MGNTAAKEQNLFHNNVRVPTRLRLSSDDDDDDTLLGSATATESSATATELPQRQVFFVGVCGPTGSGKSTLAEALTQEVASPIHPIGADMFFKFPGSSDFGSCPQRRFHNCWEHPDSVDHALLLKRLKSIKQQFATATITPEIVLKGPRGERKLNVKKGIDIDKQLGKDPVVILVEGFLLFADKNLTTFLDYHLFLDLKRETGCRRRFLRDCRGSGKAEDSNILYRGWCNQYNSHMWLHFEQFKPLQLKHVRETGKTCGHVNAELSREEIKTVALAHLKQLGLPEMVSTTSHAPAPEAECDMPEREDAAANVPKLTTSSHIFDQTKVVQPLD